MELLNTCKELLPCIVILPVIPLCFYPVQGYIRSRIPVLLAKIILSLVGFFSFFALLTFFTHFFNMDLIVLCAGVYFFYFYHKEISLPTPKKLFVFLTACLVCVFSFLFATIVDYTLYPTSNYQNSSRESIVAQFSFLLMVNGLFYIPFKKYLGWIIANYHVEQVWKSVCLILLIFAPILSTLFPHEYRRMYQGRMYGLYLVILVCLFTFVLLVYFLFYRITYAHVRQQKVEHSNRILSMQGSQYQQLLRSVQENSRIRHDFRQQLIVISELLKQKEYVKLEEYVYAFVEDTETELKVYSYSAAVNALLTYYGSLCKTKGIQTNLSLHLPDQLSISDQDFCIMLGNLLENAIYGCQGTTDPYIHLKIRQTSPNMLAIKIENPYAGVLKRVNGRFISTRHGQTGHGLESVSMIAENHQGMVEIQTEEQTFTVRVLLQISVEFS